MDAKITNSNENKANPGNYSTQGFTGDPRYVLIARLSLMTVTVFVQIVVQDWWIIMAPLILF